MSYSSKDAETLILKKMVEDVVFAAWQIEILLYESYEKRLPIHLYTDSAGTLESIASTSQVDKKSLRMVIHNLKKRLLDGEVGSYQWIPTGSMWAGTLIKEKEMHDKMQEILAQGSLWMRNEGINRVWCVDGEIRMEKIQNCNKERRD